MSVKLLTEHYLEFLRLKEAAQTCPSLHLSSKCLIVGNHMLRLNCLQQISKVSTIAGKELNRGSYMSAHGLLNLLNEL